MEKERVQRHRKSLVENAGLFKSIIVMIVCHAMVSVLCITVLYDLSFFGIPLFLFKRIGIISDNMYFKMTSAVTNWTTPIVFGFPMVYSGTRLYSNDIDILLNSKASDSLLLANHGSRIDWMVGMFIGHLKVIGDRVGERCRVGFVCEALIQFMPLIGWYRSIVCEDIFVWRSFEKDAPTIKENISKFHKAPQKRMLFLSPEGVVVDHGEKDMTYIRQCQQFAKSNDFKPFEYVLTPRYKGTSCLLDQISRDGGPLISICLAFIRDGKLLNCKLVSPDRIVPDIYHLGQGISGSPISIFIHLREITVGTDAPFDAKRILMHEYEWKDSVLKEWDERLANLSQYKRAEEKWSHDFKEVRGCRKEVLLNHLAHAAVIVGTAMAFGYQRQFIKLFFAIFCCVASTHTFGWMINESSMESVPFETGVKGLMTFFSTLEGGASSGKI